MKYTCDKCGEPEKAGKQHMRMTFVIQERERHMRKDVPDLPSTQKELCDPCAQKVLEFLNQQEMKLDPPSEA